MTEYSSGWWVSPGGRLWAYDVAVDEWRLVGQTLTGADYNRAAGPSLKDLIAALRLSDRPRRSLRVLSWERIGTFAAWH